MRIALAEDSTLLREGLAQLLTAEGHDVVHSVGTAEDLLRSVARDAPDLAVVDVRMPPDYVDEGIRAALRIRREHPRVGVLVLSQHVERRHTGELLEGTGGIGYLLKDRVSEIAGFLDAVERVGNGGTVFDPEVVRRLIAVRNASDTPLGRLSERELAVLGLLAEGHSNNAVADRLHVSRSAVEKHINTIFGKLRIPADAAYNRRVLAILEYLGTA
ncbi:two component transcriptional regulator, LuxR family [Pseudonocardia ammonioxydans]|uniref:Two component transcriptional regulator, LuxR family n=1 Tax=Pseudonocardia ammonioxydans TaxID=260086 RepID=A0A1I4VNN9_PSUAM|nr:response regulator transcription factor [Pseudonocardia ammonioxydans]SFN02800.1 two component transcriptional regulator, LuxR family [Pseudonocardia ammonioxydans]